MHHEISFSDVLDAKEQSMAALSGVSLAYALQLMNVDGFASFGLVSAWQPIWSPVENMEALRRLIDEVKSWRLGFLKLLAHWRVRMVQTDDADLAPGEYYRAAEPVLLVPGISRGLTGELALRHMQPGAVWAQPGEGGAVSLVLSGGEDRSVGELGLGWDRAGLLETADTGVLGAAYASMRGEGFVFEGFEYTAQTWVGNLMAMARGGRDDA